MKLLSKIFEYVTMAIGFPILVACLLASLFVSGVLFLALVAWLTKPIVGDWTGHIPGATPGFIIYAAIGGLVCFCIGRAWSAWERKRAVEEEIKLVSEIQIIEPLPPGQVEMFFSKDGPPDRLFNRFFGWIENIESDRVRFVVGFVVWTFVALPLGGVAMCLQRVQFRPLALSEAIPLAFLYGSHCWHWLPSVRGNF